MIRRMAFPLMISIRYSLIIIFLSIPKSFFSMPVIDYRRTTRTYLVITILPIFLIISRTSSTRTRPIAVTALIWRAFRSALVHLCLLVFIEIILVTLYSWRFIISLLTAESSIDINMLDEIPEPVNMAAIRKRITLWVPFLKIDFFCTLISTFLKCTNFLCSKFGH
ncbi:hypothetical protein V8G54_001434 [Vigna mungo]|uniref:Uncharacterized protein n=1 Tax=Vigna mungo TaxID=3915 RepID=A0AAQ3P741_VIGMU